MTQNPVPRPNGKHTWSAKKPTQRSSHKIFNLLVVTALFFATIYWFGSMLFKHEKAPDTYLLHLQTANRDSVDVQPLVLISQDEVDALGQKLGAKEIIDVIPSDSTQGDRATENAIDNTIRNLALKLKGNDVVLLYLRGYCIVRNNAPCLVVANYSPEKANQNAELSGLYDLTKLLTELEKLPAANVVVMLDHADLDVSNRFQLAETSQSYEFVKQLATFKTNSAPSNSSKKKPEILILAAKNDFQPSHIRYRLESSPATTLFFFSMQRALAEMQKQFDDSQNGFSFPAFLQQVTAFVSLGSGALQSPVLLHRGQQIDPKSENSILAFEFGKPITPVKPNETTSPATPSPSKADEQQADNTVQENAQLWTNLEYQWRQLDAVSQADKAIWPTEFAPYSWQKEIRQFRTLEFDWLISGTTPPTFPEVNTWIDPLDGPTSNAPTALTTAWDKFLRDTHCRAWLYDAAKLPKNSPNYPYQPSPDLTFEQTKQIVRELSRDGNSLSDWLRLISAYPNFDSTSASEMTEATRSHISLLLELDNAWQQLKKNPKSVPIESKNKMLRDLAQSRMRLFQTNKTPSAIDIEIENLKSNSEWTVWQLHHRCNLLLRFALLSAKQRIEILKLCKKTNTIELPPSNTESAPQSLRDNFEKSSALISRFLQSADGLSRQSLDTDVPCIVRPTLQTNLEFVSASGLNTSSINPTALTMLRTITPQSFSLLIQRKDGSPPPTELSVIFSGLNSELMRIQQAGMPVEWDKPLKCRLQNGTISFEVAALKENDTDLPTNLSISLADTNAGDSNETLLQRELSVAWPLRNEFELIAARAGTSQKFNLNLDEPLLGAALLNEEGQPVELKYEFLLHNRSRLARKAFLQIYQVEDPRRGIARPGTVFNAERRPLWEKDDLPQKVLNWKPLFPQQPLMVSTAPDETISLTALIANALKPTNPTPPANPASPQPSEASVPFGLLCEIKELDENDQIKGPQETSFIWIPLDTYDPFDSNQALRCLTQIPPFSLDDDRKLNLSLEATDNLLQLSTAPKIPIQIEFQTRNSPQLQNRQSLSFELSQPILRPLPVSAFKDDLFIAHISFGTFSRQASYVFQNNQDSQPERKPEVFAQLESIEVQTTQANTTPPAGTPNSPTPLLILLPEQESSTERRWALRNSENELRNSLFIAKINAILPAQQAFVAWRIFDVERNQPLPLKSHYEQVNRIFKVKFTADGLLNLRHTVSPLQIEYDVENIFEQEGIYELQIFANEWNKTELITSRDVERLKPQHTETIIVDRKEPAEASISLRNNSNNQLRFNSKLIRNQTYQLVLSLPTPQTNDVPIEKIQFGIDINGDGKFQLGEALKDSEATLDPTKREAKLEYKVPQEQINDIRFVAQCIDYAGNIQIRNSSDVYEIDVSSSMTEKTTPSRNKTYTLKVIVKNTSGSKPSTEVDLNMEGRNYDSKENGNEFIFKNLPAGSYQVTATSSAGTTQYEVSEKIDVSGERSTITRELKLKAKEKDSSKKP
jgi:hypothetical protein